MILKSSPKCSISLGYFIFTKSHNELPKEAQWKSTSSSNTKITLQRGSSEKVNRALFKNKDKVIL
jgi:hypothetical protein